jgi:hypothetical protein
VSGGYGSIKKGGKRNMKRLYLSLIVMFMVIPQSAMAGSGWLVFHESAFKGRVIDTETKKPIEGTAVVAMYNVYKFYPLEGQSSVIDVRESVTDNKGDFFIPSITKITVPWAVGDNTHFLVWKPGYRSEYVTQSWLFTKELGTIEERAVQTDKGFEMKPVRFGIMELQPVKTMDERRRYQPGPAGGYSRFWKKQKKFIEMIRKEHEYITGKPAGDLYK